ncbi:unnamed protein product, partial [Rotaria sp. Silwood2]
MLAFVFRSSMKLNSADIAALNTYLTQAGLETYQTEFDSIKIKFGLWQTCESNVDKTVCVNLPLSCSSPESEAAA